MAATESSKSTPKPTVQSIADELGVSVEQLARDVKRLAECLEERGNRGMTPEALQRTQPPVPTYFLLGQYEDAFKGILFYNLDEHYQGYMVRRNPPWMQVWCERYGHLSEALREECKIWHDAQEAIKRQQELAARPKRPAERFVGGAFNAYTTEQIGIRYAAAALLVKRYQRRFHDFLGRERHNELDRYLGRVWLEQEALLSAELEYRKAIGDLEASAILSEGAGRFFSKERMEAITRVAEPGDVPILSPLPPVPHVAHVRSRQWIDCSTDERVYIGRKMKEFPASVWANPHKFKDEDGRADAIRAYEQRLRGNPDLLNQIADLRGKRVLGCWCKAKLPGEEDHACHGDVLVKYIAMSGDELARLIDEAAERQIED